MRYYSDVFVIVIGVFQEHYRLINVYSPSSAGFLLTFPATELTYFWAMSPC